MRSPYFILQQAKYVLKGPLSKSQTRNLNMLEREVCWRDWQEKGTKTVADT